jgi:hypothetical protein
MSDACEVAVQLEGHPETTYYCILDEPHRGPHLISGAAPLDET